MEHRRRMNGDAGNKTGSPLVHHSVLLAGGFGSKKKASAPTAMAAGGDHAYSGHSSGDPKEPPLDAEKGSQEGMKLLVSAWRES